MTKRTTLTLTDQDEQTLASFSDPEGVEWTTLVQMAVELGIHVGGKPSEALLIRALMAAGAAAVREQALERGYEQLAELYPEIHDTDEARARRRRYAERVDRAMQ